MCTILGLGKHIGPNEEDLTFKLCYSNIEDYDIREREKCWKLCREKRRIIIVSYLGS